MARLIGLNEREADAVQAVAVPEAVRAEILRTAFGKDVEVVEAMLGSLGERGVVQISAVALCVANCTEEDFQLDVDVLVALARGTKGRRVLGLVHSHPTGPAEPSYVDYTSMIRSGLLWGIAGRSCGRRELRWFLSASQGIREIPEKRPGYE